MISNAAFTELKDLLKQGQSEKAKEVLLHLQAGYFSLLEEIHHLNLRIQALEELVDVQAHLDVHGGLVWIKTDKGQEGPYCPLCHAADGSLVRLEKEAAGWTCPSCEAAYPGCEQGQEQRRQAMIVPFKESCIKFGL